MPAVLGVRRRRGTHLRSAGCCRDAAFGHHHVPRGRHHSLPRRGDRRPGRGGHSRPCGALGVGPAARAVGVSPEHRRGHRPPRASAERTSLARRRAHRCVEHPGRSHHVQRSAVARREGVGRPASGRSVVPHVAGAARPRRVHRPVRATAHGAPGRDRGARRERGDDPRCSHRRSRARRHPAIGRQRRALPHHRAEGRLRRDPGGQVSRDGAAGCQRVNRHRRQQRLELQRHDARHVSGGRPVQGCAGRRADVPGRAGVRDGHTGRRTHHADGRSDRRARARHERRHRAARHRSSRVATVAERHEPTRLVGRWPRRAYRAGGWPGGGRRWPLHHHRRRQVVGRLATNG